MSKIITDKTNIVAIADAVRSKTGSTEELSLGEIISEIEGISGGGTSLPTLTSPASEEEVFLDKEFIDQSGTKKTGSFTIESEISEQDLLISQIQTALEGKVSGGSGGGASLESCTINFRLDNAPVLEFPTVHYVNPYTMTVDTITSVSNTTITIAAQTIIVLERTTSTSRMNGNAEQIFYAQTYAAYIVTGDCEYVIQG